jgi:hypothetical protein
MLGIAILFPPWSSSGGSPAGYHFLFLPLTRKVVYRVNSSLLCLEIVGIALITWFSFIAARHVSLSARIVNYLIAVPLIVCVGLFMWFVWPKSYYEIDSGVRVGRFTGTPYHWLNTKGWVTEAEFEATNKAENEENRARAKPVLDELRLIRVTRNQGAVDHLLISNPTHWKLPYGTSKLTIELYSPRKGDLELLKIIEQSVEIEPGIDDLYVPGMYACSRSSRLVQRIRLVATAAYLVGSEQREITLVPEFVMSMSVHVLRR